MGSEMCIRDRAENPSQAQKPGKDFSPSKRAQKSQKVRVIKMEFEPEMSHIHRGCFVGNKSSARDEICHHNSTIARSTRLKFQSWLKFAM